MSRTTADRFANIEALLVEASLDVAFPDVRGAVRRRCAQCSPTTSGRAWSPTAPSSAARTGARRSSRPLEPLHASLTPGAFDRLVMALALVVGTEAMVAFKDVLRVGDSTAGDVRRWTIEALVAAALRNGRHSEKAPRA